MNKRNYYEILGVRASATKEEIVKAYRRLAKICHPDVRKTPDAEEKMKDINEAYDVLGDTEKRRQFDEERKIEEPSPVRPNRSEEHDDRSWYKPPSDPVPPRWRRRRDEPPRYEPPPGPAPRGRQRRQPEWKTYATRLFVFFLILVVIWVALPQTTATKPQVTPQAPPVVTATPQPVVTADNRFEVWKLQGDTLMKQQRNGEALAAYDNALKVRPNASELWVIEGDIYSTRGKFDKAVACYEQALETNPPTGELVQKKVWMILNADDLMKHADLLINQENYPAAIDIYDSILSAGIQNANFQKRILSAKVYALMKAGRTDEAIRVSRLIETA